MTEVARVVAGWKQAFRAQDVNGRDIGFLAQTIDGERLRLQREACAA